MKCGLDKCDNPARLYPRGWRCAPHAPQPVNPTPDPALTLDGLREAAGLSKDMTPTASASYAAVDSRAIASGRRRSNPRDGRAAQAVVNEQKARDAALRKGHQ